jgi:hypothetical protein
MSKSYRRYEILLPLQFHDGESVPDDVIADTLIEIEQRFGAVSWETQQIHGLWGHEGQLYRDDLVRVFVDVPDTAKNRQFFRSFKKTLKVRFRQVDIWMTNHRINLV